MFTPVKQMTYYHLSEYPNLVLLKPSVPDGPEGNIPHVCATPTILGCLRGLGADCGQGYHVYVIDEKPNMSNFEVCCQVDDAHITGEQWYTHEVACRWVGYVVTVGVI